MKMLLYTFALMAAFVGVANAAEPSRVDQIIRYTRMVSATDEGEREVMRQLLDEALKGKSSRKIIRPIDTTGAVVRVAAPTMSWCVEIHKEPDHTNFVLIAPDGRGVAFKADPHVHFVRDRKIAEQYGDWSAPTVNLFAADMLLHCTATGGDQKNAFGYMKTALVANGSRTLYFWNLDKPSEVRGFEMMGSPSALIDHLADGIRKAPSEWYMGDTNDIRNAGGLITNQVGPSKAPPVNMLGTSNGFVPYVEPKPTKGEKADGEALKKLVEEALAEYAGHAALAESDTPFAKQAGERRDTLRTKLIDLRKDLGDYEAELHTVAADMSPRQIMAARASKNAKIGTLFADLRGR